MVYCIHATDDQIYHTSAADGKGYCIPLYVYYFQRESRRGWKVSLFRLIDVLGYIFWYNSRDEEKVHFQLRHDTKSSLVSRQLVFGVYANRTYIT